MNIDIDYKSFCAAYYTAAKNMADMTIANHIKKNGPINQHIDVELVKDLAVSYALEKVYCKYDVDHESKAGINAFLSKVVHNCVLTELGKESTKVHAGKRNDRFDLLQDPGSGARFGMNDFKVYIESGRKYEKKEDLIKEVLACVKKLSGVDQVILNCWMLYKRSEYTGHAIEELGWEDTARNRSVVHVRCNRAIAMLQRMMNGVRSDYRDIYVSPFAKKTSEPASEPKENSDVDYNYMRRRQRAAKKSISGKIDYTKLSNVLTTDLPD